MPPLARLPYPHPYCVPRPAPLSEGLASVAQGAGHLPAGLSPAARRPPASPAPGPTASHSAHTALPALT